ncbi:hypothetical protein ACFQ1L_31320 [Phytohabitans flavus]|uniref:hypothetical protein n=1 Tax=Phytohabitans flavus TaxID=1076124 RepID=UPI003644E27B
MACVLLVLTVAGCGGDQDPSAEAPTPTPSPSAALNRFGMDACRAAAQMLKEGDWSAGNGQMLGSLAKTANHKAIFDAGDSLFRAATAVAATPDEPGEREALSAAQQGLWDACKSVLGDEPW